MMGRVAFALLLLLPVTVSAQTVYKTVGPDGKVTFSDEPPGEGKTTALEGYRPPLVKTLEKKPAERAAEMSRQALERHEAKRAQGPATPAPAPAAPDPALGQAIIGVLAFEDLVQQTEKLCISTLPTSLKKYGAAADGWRQRNAAILQQARAVMANALSAEQRRSLEKVVEEKSTQQMTEVVRASTPARIKWCDRSAEEINQGVLDPKSRQAWAGALQRAQTGR